MRVKSLIDLLQRFDAEAEVRLSVHHGGRVIEIYHQVLLGDYGGGPQLIALPEFRGSCVYAGCGLEQLLMEVQPLDLGRYATPEEAAKVRDYFVVSQGLKERLHFPEFDYEHWIPPRTVSGEYNEQIARILREKLLKD
jgi:hypothetical protein